MAGWKNYVYSLIVCSLVCGIITKTVSDPKRKKLIRLITGTVLAVSVLRPLSGINSEDIKLLPTGIQSSAELYISEGEKTATEALKQCIEASCEEYILEKARALGTEITVQVFTDHSMLPAFVEIKAEAVPEIQNELQTMLTTDLGIPKENQQWIWNRESNNS